MSRGRDPPREISRPRHTGEHARLYSYMCWITLSPNSLHLISVAPSMSRAKS
jgi:hypothetical protein